MCTFSAQEEESIHLERIYKDEEFWNDCITKVEIFLKICLLPELLGNWHTRPVVMPSGKHQAHQNTATKSQPTYCYCNSPDVGKMIGCDNEDCEIEWFHLKCLKLPKVLSQMAIGTAQK